MCGSPLNGEPVSALHVQARRFPTFESLSEAKQKLLPDFSFEHRGKEFDLCLPVATDERTGGQLTISAQWIEVAAGDHTWNSASGWTVFDLAGDGGRDASAPYASAASDTSHLDFRCPVGPGRAKNTELSVVIATHGLSQNHDARAPEDLTRIGYGAAVKLARRMNCLPESKLPPSLGDLKKLA